ncbi:MAG TPA: MBL fold metallo-hydrolase [Flavisolibacter sp.]|nr:MBL fold metallo-hydrolase [Flavisolibacter sp.]
MHRRRFLSNTGLVMGAGLFFQKQSLARMLNTFDYNIRMLRGNVGIFTERGGTIGFHLGKEGIVVIDAQFPDTAAHLIEDLKKRNSNPFRYLLNTHHHGDHTSGNIAFKGIVEKILAHENSLANQKSVAEKNNATDKQLYPDTTFTEDWKLKLADEKIKADYFGAGHTNGDAVYHFENANILHAGDLMFNKRHPFVDRSAGANIASWIKDLDKIIKKSDRDTIVIFGHSLNPGEETGTIEDVKKFQDYLGKVLAFAQDSIKKGMSKDEFVKSTSIPGVTEWTGQGIERPLAAAYEELTTGK